MKRALLAVVLAGCTGGLVRDTTLEPFAQTPEQIARGKYLVDALAARSPRFVRCGRHSIARSRPWPNGPCGSASCTTSRQRTSRPPTRKTASRTAVFATCVETAYLAAPHGEDTRLITLLPAPSVLSSRTDSVPRLRRSYEEPSGAGVAISGRADCISKRRP